MEMSALDTLRAVAFVCLPILLILWGLVEWSRYCPKCKGKNPYRAPDDLKCVHCGDPAMYESRGGGGDATGPDIFF